MGFEIGKVYDRLAITRRFGYSDDRQSVRGGLFFRDNTVILIKDEEGEQYEDRWGPDRPGTLLYYATLKSVQVNKEPGIRDLPINSGANKALRDGDHHIILFSKSKDSYRYMGEFERTDAEPIMKLLTRASIDMRSSDAYRYHEGNTYKVAEYEVGIVSLEDRIQYITEDPREQNDPENIDSLFSDSKKFKAFVVYDPKKASNDLDAIMEMVTDIERKYDNT